MSLSSANTVVTARRAYLRNKLITVFAFVAAVTVGLTSLGVAPAQAAGNVEAQAASATAGTRQYALNLYSQFAGGSQIYGRPSEWMLIALARDLNGESQSYYKSYYDQVVAKLDSQGGVAPSTKTTNDDRVILALTAFGYDATNVGGYNLFSALTSLHNVTVQGANSAAYALVAVNSNPKYSFVKAQDSADPVTIEGLVDYIASEQRSDGSWMADPDRTSMSLYGLAPLQGTAYDADGAITAIIDKGVAWLSKAQQSTGGYSSWGTANSNSDAQVLTALTALNISPNDPRFMKDGNTVVSSLLSYYVEDGSFKYTHDDAADGMATEQCYYALVAYQRYAAGENALFSMADASVGGSGSGNTDSGNDSNGNNGSDGSGEVAGNEGDSGSSSGSGSGPQSSEGTSAGSSSSTQQQNTGITSYSTVLGSNGITAIILNNTATTNEDEIDADSIAKEDTKEWEFTAENFKAAAKKTTADAVTEQENALSWILPTVAAAIAVVIALGIVLSRTVKSGRKHA